MAPGTCGSASRKRCAAGELHQAFLRRTQAEFIRHLYQVAGHAGHLPARSPAGGRPGLYGMGVDANRGTVEIRRPPLLID